LISNGIDTGVGLLRACHPDVALPDFEYGSSPEQPTYVYLQKFAGRPQIPFPGSFICVGLDDAILIEPCFTPLRQV